MIKEDNNIEDVNIGEVEVGLSQDVGAQEKAPHSKEEELVNSLEEIIQNRKEAQKEQEKGRGKEKGAPIKGFFQLILEAFKKLFGLGSGGGDDKKEKQSGNESLDSFFDALEQLLNQIRGKEQGAEVKEEDLKVVVDKAAELGKGEKVEGLDELLNKISGLETELKELKETLGVGADKNSQEQDNVVENEADLEQNKTSEQDSSEQDSPEQDSMDQAKQEARGVMKAMEKDASPAGKADVNATLSKADRESEGNHGGVMR